MSSITIHNIEEDLDEIIREKAKKDGASLNKTIKNVLRKSFNLDTEQTKKRKELFADIFGSWSKQAYEEFISNTEDFNRIDTEEWE